MAWFRRLLVISGALSLCLLLLNLQTKGRCYIQPCEQGSGLADLFTVHFGLSFQGISAAAALLAHALYGWAVAARKNNMYRVGLMVGVSVTATLLAAQTTVLWASQVYLMKGMHRHRVFRESGRVSFDSAALELDFALLLAASSGLLLSHLAMLWCLHQWRDAQLRPAGGEEALSPMALG